MKQFLVKTLGGRVLSHAHPSLYKGYNKFYSIIWLLVWKLTRVLAWTVKGINLDQRYYKRVHSR